MGLKEAYQEKLEAQVKEWAVKLTELKAKADQAGADAKIQMYKQIDQLQAQKEAAQQKLSQIKSAGAESWEALKAGSEKTLADMKETWKALKSKFQ
jgi:hypothetical protein